jgi:putative ABC transport system permease protein
VQLNEAVSSNNLPVSIADLEELRRQSKSFEAVIGYSTGSKNLQGTTDGQRVPVVATERGLFPMLGIQPMLGRLFREDDPLNVAVIGKGFWKQQLAGNQSPIGSKITLDGQTFTVIGVMPEAFQFPYSAEALGGGGEATYAELWIPWDIPPHTRWQHLDFVVGRLKPGVTLGAARSEMKLISQSLEAQYPETNAGSSFRITPLLEVVARRVRNSLLLLLGATGLVLLVACANVANLLLVRAATRTREVAIRAALGAGRFRVVRQFLTESVLLTLAGGLTGLVIAKSGTRLLLSLTAGRIPRSAEIGLDWRVFLFLLAVSVLTGIGCGLVPAIVAMRVDVLRNLKESGSSQASDGHSRRRVGDALVISEVALAFVLLIGAGLLLRSFLRLQRTPSGMAATNVVTMHLLPEASPRQYNDLEKRIEQIPGVRAAGFSQLLPLQNWGWTAHFTIDERPPETPSRQPLAELRFVTPGYFGALGIPLRKGRGFTDHDNSDSPSVVLVNEALARQYFPNEDPVGRHTNRGTIVGVIGDVHQAGLDRPAEPEIYNPVAQNVVSRSDSGMSLVVNTELPPETLVTAVRSAIHEVNPNLTLFNIKTMKRVVADSLLDFSLHAWLVGVFSGVALLLAAVGIYAVVSHVVGGRTREFGIRLALGADSGSLLRLVLAHGGVLVGTGLAVGVAGALGLTRLLKNLLFGISPIDPLTFAAVAAILAAAGLIACWLPARRAAKVDPMVALRYE